MGNSKKKLKCPAGPTPKYASISAESLLEKFNEAEEMAASWRSWKLGRMVTCYLLFICLREPNQKNALGLWTASEKNWLYWRFLCAPTLALKKHCSSGTKQVTKIRHKKQKWSEKLHIKQMAAWPRMAAWFHKTKGSSPRCRVYCLMEFAEDCIQASEAVKVRFLCWNLKHYRCCQTNRRHFKV